MHWTLARRRAAWAAVWLSLLALASIGHAASNRFSHAAVLLPDGSIAYFGGQNLAGPLKTIDLLLPSNNAVVAPSGANSALQIARSSATATLLPNGKVLIAGGFDGATIRADAEVYDPVTQSVVTGVTPIGGMTARMDHTATLLQNGTVLLCGGWKAPGSASNTCDIFDPKQGTNGAFTGTVNLLAARTDHTASLLKDGRVFITGGLSAPGSYLQTSELYTQGQSATTAGHPLIQQRAYHQATVMADGRVLVSGGYNAIQTTYTATGSLYLNFGYLDTSEIYDPLNSVLPAGTMEVRRAFSSTLLQPDGTVALFGGLGNVAPQILTSQTYPITSATVGSTSNAISTDTITSGSGNVTVNFQINPSVAGVIQTGSIYLANPTIQLSNNAGTVNFTSGDPVSAPTAGLQLNLAGVPVTCPNTTACGQVSASLPFALPASNIGTYFMSPVSVTLQNQTLVSPSSVCFTGGVLGGGTGQSTNLPVKPQSLNVGLFTTSTMTLGTFAPEFEGAQISTGYFVLTSGGIVLPSSFTVTITYAVGDLLNAANSQPVNVSPVTITGGQAQVILNWRSVTGTISFNGSGSQSFGSAPGPSCVTLPQPAGPNPTLAGQAGKVYFGANQLTLAGDSLNVSGATVVVQQMASADFECYQPSNNSWTFGCITRNNIQPSFMQTGTVRPSGDMAFYGGETVSGSGLAMAPNQLLSIDRYIAQAAGSGSGWNAGPAMKSPRANFTATPLPSGKLLLAGGANAANSQVALADLFDPTANQITATSSMTIARDLHSATLLDNGRVLVAGGFSNGQPTNLAEIYYPDTGVWLQTTPMISTRDSHVGLLLPDGTVLVAGGFANGQYLNTAEVYISTAGVWQPTANNMTAARALAAASLLPDGRVLITGGINATGALPSTELYDPKTRQFVAGPNMVAARYSHTATLLPHGDVMIAGGDGGNGALATTERYHPTSNTFTAASSMSTARLSHTATLLPDGVLVVTGGLIPGNALSSVELYHENDDHWQTSLALSANRGQHAAVVAQNGMIYALGGYNGSSYLSTTESIYFEGNVDGGNSSVRQSSITALSPLAFDRGNTLVATGTGFLGATEASGGGGAAGNSSHFQPRVQLQAVDGGNGTSSQGGGGFFIDLSTYVYANAVNAGNWAGVNTSITLNPLPTSAAGLPYGWYHLRESNNAVFSNSLLVHAGPNLPANPPTNLVGTPNSQSQITWTWAIPAGTFDGFNVYYATSGVFITTVAVQGSAGQTETWIATGLAPDTTGQIKVAAYNLSGDGPSATSPIAFTQTAVPTNVAVTTVTSGSVGLTWSANGNSPGTIYEISMSTLGLAGAFQAGDGSISTPVPTLLSLTTTNYLIQNLQPNFTYSFRLRAFNGSNIPSNFSAVVSTQTTAPLNGLQGVRLGPTSIQWTWVASCAGQSPCSYRVYNATSGVVIASTGNPVFIETGLSTNTANAIQVQAVTGAGPGVLSPSATVYTDATAPGLSAFPITSITTGSFTVSWTANGNPLNTQYQVVVTQLGGSFTSTTTTTGFFVNVGGLSPPASIFAVAVRAVNGDGFGSDVDNPAAFLNLGNSSTLANPPTNLASPSVTPTSAFLTWNTNNNSSLATYEVTYTTDNFTDVITAVAFSANFSSSSLNVNNLVTSSTYTFRVRAQNPAGQITAYSNFLTTGTSSGGAPPGELGGIAAAGANSYITGSLGNGRQVNLFIPGGTFPSDTFIVISSYNIVTPGAPCPNGSNVAVTITPTPYFQPSKPVTVTLSYSPAEVASITNISQAALMRIDPSGTCVPLPTVVSQGNQTFTAQINHFSTYQLAQLKPASSVGGALIFPNPFYPNRSNGFVTFDQLPVSAWVRIFTLRGELVFEASANGSGLVTWPGTNRSGRPAASGVYLVEIEQGGDKHIFKLAVER